MANAPPGRGRAPRIEAERRQGTARHRNGKAGPSMAKQRRCTAKHRADQQGRSSATGIGANGEAEQCTARFSNGNALNGTA